MQRIDPQEPGDMTFAFLTMPPAGQRLRRSVETRLAAFGYGLRQAGTSARDVFDIVCARDGRVVWVSSSLDEIACLGDHLLGSLRGP